MVIIDLIVLNNLSIMVNSIVDLTNKFMLSDEELTQISNELNDIRTILLKCYDRNQEVVISSDLESLPITYFKKA
jgi:hypothetical protein